MKKLKFLLAGLALMALPVFVWAGLASAQKFSTHVGEDETVDSSLYSAGQNVEINGTVNGDIFCAGQNVRINATVRGDVICAGQNVTIKGKIDGDIRAAGQNVTIDAEVSRSITLAGQTVSFDADATAGGDATLGGQNLNLKGSVGRDAMLGGDEVVLNGQIGRNVEANTPGLDVRAGAQIGGALTYTSKTEASIATGAKIVGDITRKTPQEKKTGGLWGIGTGMYIYFLAATLLFTLVLALFFPQALRKTGDVAKAHFGKSLLTGFVATIAIPVIAFALGVTFIGLPMTFMLLMLWGLLAAASMPVAGYFLGKLLFKKNKNTVLLALVGVAILATVYYIPFLGFIICLLAYFIGLGALLLAAKRQLPKPVYKG